MVKISSKNYYLFLYFRKTPNLVASRDKVFYEFLTIQNFFRKKRLILAFESFIKYIILKYFK